MPKPSVFISGTREDLREYLDAAKESALHAGFAPEMQEYFPAEGRKSLDACLKTATAIPRSGESPWGSCSVR